MTTIEIASQACVRIGRPQWLVVHYRRDDEGYGDWSLHAWGDIAPDAITGFPGGHPFAGADAYGRVDIAIVRTGDNAGASGAGLLAALMFDAIGEGSSQIQVSGVASTPEGVPISLQFSSASVTVR